jgi:hypothetical protein
MPDSGAILRDACFLDGAPRIQCNYQTIASICIWGELPMAPAQIPHNFHYFSLPLVANLATALRLLGFNKRLHIRAT